MPCRSLLTLGKPPAVSPSSCAPLPPPLAACPGQVRVHERVHTGAKPYKCRYCDYRASQSGNVRVHERRHLGEPAFDCP
jgi:uncharacterized Zn-finger protein